MRRKKIKWNQNDVFAIPLLNGNYAIGHVLDQTDFVNAVRIALYDEIIKDFDDIDLNGLINDKNLISLIEVTREQLDYGVWKIIGNKQTTLPIEKYANEQTRINKWVGSTQYGAGLAEDFINSYYALLPWDDWYIPDFLDEFLVSPSKKPGNLIYKKKD
jgi:hypothetical protein